MRIVCGPRLGILKRDLERAERVLEPLVLRLHAAAVNRAIFEHHHRALRGGGAPKQVVILRKRI
jgi:hypothetical protein